MSDAENGIFFAQFGEQNPAGCQFLVRHETKVVGFATVFFSFTSTLAAKVAVLNNLYTVPDMRGNGVGRGLIEHCRQFAASHGALRL
ncbi:MAG: GNAT family N-acetyltransferase [Immundisolibacteraceae bacterium]|nr:GNAT family N-acetyltransferase [Immundisolibacteraceae bacterium]